MLDDEAPFFPRRATLRVPSPTEFGERFEEARAWLAALDAGARHYRVTYEEVRHRQLGTNVFPKQAWIDTREDALALIGKRAEAAAFDRIVAETRERRPLLLAWLAQRPRRALDLADAWSRLLDVVDWLEANPRPHVYLRQVDLPGVDSKFIEGHRGVLAELLDLVLPAEAIRPEATGRSGFEARYGFRPKPTRVRFRVLDPLLSTVRATADEGITLPPGLRTAADEDVAVPIDLLAALAPPASRVFIIENEIDFLAFPNMPGTLAIFGSGYGFDALADVAWLRQPRVLYWGDIDTHGLAILNELRAVLPHARSFLMDRETLLAHRGSWGREPKPARHDLPRLTADEASLYDDLRRDVLGECVRLEQERIRFSWLERALRDEGASTLRGAR